VRGWKNLSLIGLSNRNVRSALSQRRGYEVGFFSWLVGESVFSKKIFIAERFGFSPLGETGEGFLWKG
jgi:hypothetical protein